MSLYYISLSQEKSDDTFFYPVRLHFIYDDVFDALRLYEKQ